MDIYKRRREIMGIEEDKSIATNSRDSLKKIPLSDIHFCPDHPFQVRLDESMNDLTESIKTYGVQTPALVRPRGDGSYELVSGHRRHKASELAGLETLPCIVRRMSRDEAVIAMVDANIQREHILPSEKAKAYKMKLNAMKRQGQRTDLTSAPLEPKLRSNEELADSSGESAAQIKRYIRLNELIPELLDMTDDKEIAFRPAVELSYLTPEKQRMLYDNRQIQDCTPSLTQAIKMKRLQQENHLTNDVIYSILTEEKPNQKEQIRIPREKIKEYFTPETPETQIEADIIAGLKLLREREKRQEKRKNSPER